MNKDRINLLAESVRSHVWLTLDSEPDVDTMDAGIVASVCERAFLFAMQTVHDDPQGTSCIQQRSDLLQTVMKWANTD